MRLLRWPKKTLVAALATCAIGTSQAQEPEKPKPHAILRPYEVQGEWFCRKEGSPMWRQPKPKACDESKRLVDRDLRRDSKISVHLAYAFRAGYAAGYCPIDDCKFDDFVSFMVNEGGLDNDALTDIHSTLAQKTPVYEIPDLSLNMRVLVYKVDGQVVVNCHIVEKSLNASFTSDLEKCFALQDLDEIIS